MIEPVDSCDPWVIRLEPLGDVVRVEFLARTVASSSVVTHGFLDHGHKVQLQTLRDVADAAPYPIWKTDPRGRVIWQNRSYAALFRMAHGAEPQPNQPLFPDLPGDPTTEGTRRVSLTVTDQDDPGWYDITTCVRGEERILFALDVNPLVQAETTQRNFVQTLAKTFAQLSIGLAIFDRRMQLILFNPALIDLTNLPAEFLSMRPNLLSFFDRLRDSHVMPEPKNYGSWREKMSSLVAAAADGSYCETWTLASGSTYRVSGRPHPDGAIAFLFEDISAEISLTRRFRADLELSQTIIDEFDDAIAVFNSGGILTVTNKAYRTLWDIDPEEGFAETSVIDAMRIWQEVAGASPVWGELRDFVLARENRTAWAVPITNSSGQPYFCAVSPVDNGATLVRFSQNADRQFGTATRMDYVAE